VNKHKTPLKIDGADCLFSCSLSSVVRSDWKWLALGAVLSFFLASALMSGWPAGLLPNLAYPFTYDNDGAFHGIQRLIEGWSFDNARVGYPFGSNYMDYPSSDLGHLLTVKFLGTYAGEWHVVHNLYFLIGFVVTFVASYLVFRVFSLAIPFAFTAAILFNFLPFHFQRLPHLFLTWYFVIPIFYYIAFRFLILAPRNEAGKASFSQKLGYVLCLIGLGSFGVYYAFFGIILLVSVGGFGLAANYNLKLLKSTVFISFMVFAGVLLNVTPNLIHEYLNGSNPEVAQRDAGESELYGFKFAQLVVPRLAHRNAKLAAVSSRYTSTTPLNNENTSSTLGVVGTFGLLVVFGIIFLTLAGKTLNKTLMTISLIVLVLFMFGTIGGFGSIFAQLITTSIRAWNRVSVFIGFGALLVFFLALQLEVQKRVRGYYSSVLLGFIAVILLLGGLYDQTTSACQTCNDEVEKAFNRDREFVQSIEKSLPVGSAVYQLPYMPYPEVPPLHRLKDYELFSGFLHSTALNWSYGGMKGRSGDLFFRSLAREPLSRQVEVLEQLGFAGVYVDRRGYDVKDDTVVEGLTDVLDASSALTRADGNVVFFRLGQTKMQINLKGLSSAQLMRKAGYIADHLGPRYEATLSDGIDFTRPTFPTFVQNVQGLSGHESWGRWSDENLAKSVRVDMTDPIPSRFNLVFLSQAFGPNVGQDLVVKLGSQVHRFRLREGLFEYRKVIDLSGEETFSIEFLPPQPTSPMQINISGDKRMLGIGLVKLYLNEIDGHF